jgi:transcriptional regulator MraZ
MRRSGSSSGQGRSERMGRGPQAHSVLPFVSTVVNKLDAKGRVSIPAPFRQILAQQNLHGIYCIPSFVSPALEAFGETLLAQFQERLRKFDPLFSDDYDAQAQAVLGQTQFLNFDDEGRIRLPDDLIAHAGITERVAFIGLDQKFQMWDPVRFEPVQKDRIARARAVRAGGGGAA